MERVNIYKKERNGYPGSRRLGPCNPKNSLNQLELQNIIIRNQIKQSDKIYENYKEEKSIIND